MGDFIGECGKLIRYPSVKTDGNELYNASVLKEVKTKSLPYRGRPACRQAGLEGALHRFYKIIKQIITVGL